MKKSGPFFFMGAKDFNQFGLLVFVFLITGIVIFYPQIRENTPSATVFLGSFPTFMHVFLFSIFTVAVSGQQKNGRIIVPVIWTFANILLEISQMIPIGRFKATFDPLDVLAAILGGWVSYCVIPRLSPQVFSKRLHLASLIFGFATLTGTSKRSKQDITKGNLPIYWTYEELRSSFKVEPVTSIDYPGKTLISEDLILVNSPNKGLTIVDNQDPTKPVPKYFLNIPGNLDFLIRDKIIYADSFIDLLVIDIHDLGDIKLLKRFENILTYDPYQAIKKEITIGYGTFDPEKGVIVGVK